MNNAPATTTFTFLFDGLRFPVQAATKLDAFGIANARVRAHGVTDAFAWFDTSSPTIFVLGHDVLMD